MKEGVIVVDKPGGMTSFDVVRKVRRASGVKRVGHGGTLDPLATGVLPVCLGEATKLAPFLLDADKEYEVTMCLGVETDTLDAAGQVTARAPASALGEIDESMVRAALPAFTGRISQTPPAYSALKRAGRPLYDYARRGQPVAAAPRAVSIHELALTGFAGPEAVSLRVRCSKGTYVRSLVADLGQALGPGAHVTALRRTRSGPFSLAGARPLDDVLAALGSAGGMDGTGLLVVTLEAALAHLPRCFAGEDATRALIEGRRVPWNDLVPALEHEPDPAGTATTGPGRTCVLRPDGSLLAVAERRSDDSVRTLRVFSVSASPPRETPRWTD